MKGLILIFWGILLVFILNSCSTNKYISNISETDSYAGTWQFRDHKDRILQITLIEENVYNLKFDSETNDWQGIGYQIDGELLAIFNYYYIGQKGYITFNFIDKDKIQFQSISPEGEFRSEGYFIRLSTH